jgi:hypothetical protein
VYKSFPWEGSKFTFHVRDGTEKKEKDNHREFLDDLGRKLGFKSMSDWYTITRKQIIENGGHYLVQQIKNPSKLVMAAYPRYHWISSNWNCKSEDYQNEENRVALMEYLTKELQIKDLSDWYRISRSQIGQVCKNMNVFKQYTLEELLPEAYPNHDWNKALLVSLRQRDGKVQASQRWLRVLVHEIFSNSGTSLPCLV